MRIVSVPAEAVKEVLPVAPFAVKESSDHMKKCYDGCTSTFGTGPQFSSCLIACTIGGQKEVDGVPSREARTLRRCNNQCSAVFSIYPLFSSCLYKCRGWNRYYDDQYNMDNIFTVRLAAFRALKGNRADEKCGYFCAKSSVTPERMPEVKNCMERCRSGQFGDQINFELPEEFSVPTAAVSEPIKEKFRQARGYWDCYQPCILSWGPSVPSAVAGCAIRCAF